MREPGWRARFRGKQNGDAREFDEDITNISGATMSRKRVTDGVRRLLALHDLALKGR